MEYCRNRQNKYHDTDTYHDTEMDRLHVNNRSLAHCYVENRNLKSSQRMYIILLVICHANKCKYNCAVRKMWLNITLFMS